MTKATKFTATFANGTVMDRNSKTKAYTHAFNITRDGDGRGTFFATSLERAQKACAAEIARLTRCKGAAGLAFEIVEVTTA